MQSFQWYSQEVEARCSNTLQFIYLSVEYLYGQDSRIKMFLFRCYSCDFCQDLPDLQVSIVLSIASKSIGQSHKSPSRSISGRKILPWQPIGQEVFGSHSEYSWKVCV